MKHLDLEPSAPPKKKARLLLYLLLLVLLGVAAAGVWGGYQFMRHGEIAVALPESLAPLVADKLGVDDDGRLGPLRFDSAYFREKFAGVGPDLSYPLRPSSERDALQFSGENTEEQPDQVASGGRIALRPDQVLHEQRLPRIDARTGQPADGVSDAPAGGQYVTPRDLTEIPPPPADGDEYLDGSGRVAADGSTVIYPESPSQARARARQDAAPLKGEASPTISSSLSPETEARELMPPVAGGPANSGRTKAYSGEDSVVTLEFVEDLAGYLAANYWPAGSHPAAASQAVSTASVRSINQRYGIDLRGFAGSNSSVRDYYRDRGLILNYVFMPSMIQALTQLYADRFADALARAGSGPILNADGRERRLTPTENAAMLTYYANSIKALGAAFIAYADTPDAAALVNAYIRAESEAFAAHARFLDAQQAESLAAESGDNALILEAERDVTRLERVYHISRGKQKRAEDEIYKFMTKGGVRYLDAATLVYTASWLNRRSPDSMESVRAAASGADFLAGVLNEKAAELRSRR